MERYSKNVAGEIWVQYTHYKMWAHEKCTDGVSWRYFAPSASQMCQNKIPEVLWTYKDVSKSSRTVLVKRSLLTLDVKFLHHLQSTPLLHEYSGTSVSAMLGSIPESPFLELCQVPAAIPLESLQWCRIFDPSSEALAWEEDKVTGGQIG